jgi:hypothetical protein
MDTAEHVFGPRTFDLWIFHRQGGEPRYLMLRTSQAKADKWFGGGRFWQVPGDFYAPGEGTLAAIRRHMGEWGLAPLAGWACEHVYTIWNRRFDAIQHIPVFCAEVAGPSAIPLTWEHSEAGWFTAAEAHERINFWALHEGLDRCRRLVIEAAHVPAEFRIL